MATVIDALIVSLKLDSSGFDAGQKKMVTDLRGAEAQAKRSAMAIDGYGTQASQFFSKMRNQALALFAVFTAGRGMRDFVTGTVTMASSTLRMAQVLGMSTQQLTAWQGAVQQAVGGTAEGATTSMQNLTRSFQQMSLTGTSSAIPYFRALGVNVEDARRRMRPMTDVLMDVSRSMQGMDPARAMMMGQGLGLDPGMINLLRLGPTAVRSALAQQNQQGVVTGEQSRKLDQLRQAFVGIEKVSETLGRVLLTDLAPGLTAVLNAISQWAAKNPGTATTLGIGGAATGGILGALGLRSAWAWLFGGGRGAAAAAGGAPAVAGETAAAAGGGGWLGMLGAAFPWAAGAAMALWPTPAYGETSQFHAQQQEALKRFRVKPGGSAGPIALPAPGSAQAGVMERVRADLKAKGYTDPQIAGVLSNIAAESGFNPAASGDNGTSYGLFQFHAARLAALRMRYGANPTVDQQVAFAANELRTSEWQAGLDLHAARSPEAAAAAFTGFERPADPGASIRRANAAHLFVSPGAGLAGARGGAGTQVTIGNVTVNTQATDARGIARDIGTELRRVTVVPQAAGGLD